MPFFKRLFARTQPPEVRFCDRLVKAMWQEWLDPKSADDYRRLNGWTNDHPDWCGQIVAVAAREIGIKLDYARHIIPSTYRLASSEYADNYYDRYNLPEFDQVHHDQIKPGHIICVETSRGKPYGDHIAVVVDVQGDRLITIEGNANGLSHRGSYASRSVVLQSRDRKDVRRAYEIPSSAIR